MGIRIVRSLPEEEWRQFVDEHPLGNIFHTPEMFQVFNRAHGHRPELWAATNQDRRVLALLAPVQITLGGGLSRFLTTRAVAYGSVLCDSSAEGQEGLAILLDAYTREVDRTVLFTELRNLGDLGSLQTELKRCGFVYEDHLNYLIDLNRSVDEILQGMSKRTRKQVRRGLRVGEVMVEEVVRREQVALCYDLMRRTYAAARVPLAHRSLFEEVFDGLYPKGMVKFWLVRVGETYVATSVELLFKDVVYGWYAGTDRTFASHNPGELLVWHILSWAAEHGYRVYDFGGAGRPGEEYGVREFKAKFGGRLVNCGRNTRVHAPIRLIVSKLGYSAYQILSWRK